MSIKTTAQETVTLNKLLLRRYTCIPNYATNLIRLISKPERRTLGFALEQDKALQAFRKISSFRTWIFKTLVNWNLSTFDPITDILDPGIAFGEGFAAKPTVRN